MQKIGHLLNFIFAITTCNYVISQQLDFKWQRTLGGESHDGFTAGFPTCDGGYLAAGVTFEAGTGNITEASLGLEDYWIVKLNSEGEIEWENLIGGSKKDIVFAAIQLSDNSYIIGGTSNSPISGDKDADCYYNDSYYDPYSYDCWILKLNNIGEIVWQKTFGGKEYDEVQSIAEYPNGDILVACKSWSDTSQDKSKPAFGLSDVWLVAFDANGNKLWDRIYGGELREGGVQIELLANGNFIVGCSSESHSSGNKLMSTKGEYDIWLFEINDKGDFVWQKGFGGWDSEYFADVQQTLDGGFLVGISSYSDISGDKIIKSNGNSDYWILKLDKTGNIEWQTAVGGSEWDALSNIIVQPNGNYLIGGNSASPSSGDKTEQSRGDKDFWLLQISGDGNVLWDKTIGGNNNDFLIAMHRNNDNKYYLGGYSLSGFSGEKTESYIGWEDYWIIQLFETNFNENITFDFFSINPNPVHHTINVTMQSICLDTYTIEIWDTEGRMVLMQNMATNNLQIPVAALSPGLYFIRIETEAGFGLQKFVKE